MLKIESEHWIITETKYHYEIKHKNRNFFSKTWPIDIIKLNQPNTNAWLNSKLKQAEILHESLIKYIKDDDELWNNTLFQEYLYGRMDAP